MLTDMETVGTRLKRCRQAAKMTQEAVGKAIGATRSAIAQVELEISNSLNAENIARAAKLFGKNALWLATGEGPEDASDALNEALDALPDGPRQQAFDFLLYQIDKAREIYSDRPGHYADMIERIKADMDRRKKDAAAEVRAPDRLRDTHDPKRPADSKTRKLL